MTRWISIPFVALLIAVPVVGAQDASPDSLLRTLLTQNRYPVALTPDGQLSGTGGEWLLRQGRDAQFLLVGESHGVAEIPQVTSALFQALRPVGYDHLVIETGPHTAALLESAARAGGVDSLRAIARKYPLSIPFYVMDEDVQLFADAVAAGGEVPVAWGVDQEFVGSPVLWLAAMEGRAPSQGARDLARRYRLEEEAAIAEGNMGALFMMRATPDDYVALRDAFAGDELALAQLDAVEESATIYRMLMAERRTYESNDRRAQLMRQTFLDRYRRTETATGKAPRAVLRFGANHGFRGQNPFHVYDIGSLIAELGVVEGRASFHLYIIPGAGTERVAFSPSGPRTVPVGDYADSWAAPMVAAAESTGWSLYDLRPLRAPLEDGHLGEVNPDFERVVFGYDAVLLLTGSTPAGFDQTD